MLRKSTLFFLNRQSPQALEKRRLYRPAPWAEGTQVVPGAGGRAGRQRRGEDTVRNQITGKLENAFFHHFHNKPSPAEVGSWRNSLRAIAER